MADINTIFRITAKVSGQDSIKKLNDEIAKVSTGGDKMKRFAAQGALAFRAMAAGGVAAAGAAALLAVQAVNLADELNDISQRTGVAVEQLAKYKVAAENSGTSIDALAASFGKLNKNLVDARDGTGPAAAAFRAMGISVLDANGNLKNADQITAEVADTFAQFPDGPQKAALAMAVFGKSGAELIPMLNMGSEEIKAFGLSIDQEFATAADAFNDKIGIIRNGVTEFGIDIAKKLLPAVSGAIDAFGQMFDLSGTAELFGEIMGKVITGITVAVAALVAGVKNAIAVLQGLGAASVAVLELAKGNFDVGRNGLMLAYEDMAGKIVQNQADLQAQIDAALGKGAGGGPLSVTIRPKLSAGIKNNMANFATGGAAGKAASDAEKAAEATEKWVTKQQEAIETLKLENEFIGKTSIEIEKLKDAREIDAEVAEKTANMTAEQAAKFREQAEAIKQARQEILQYNYEQKRTFGAGASEFLAKYVEDATNTAQQVKDVMSNAFKGAEDALVDFVTTGKLDFKSLADSIIKDLARIMIQRSILGPLASALGGMFGGGASAAPTTGTGWMFANGGIMSSNGPLPLNTYANGGIANTPQLAMFGEGRMNEAFVPLPDGRSIPVSMQGGMGQQNNVTVNVKVESGQTDVKSSSAQMQALGKKMAEIAKATLINEKRPGGLLAATA